MTSLSQQQNNIIYFDNAATSYPKPKGVVESVVEYMTNIGANPGRSGHLLSIKAGELVHSAREAAAELFGVSNPMRVIFTSNATDALNLAIQRSLENGDHVITTAMEHNSTIRPLKELENKKNIGITILPSYNGLIDMDEVKKHITSKTKAMVINHASNTFGTIQPLKEIGNFCKNNNITLIADCAQSAGIVPISMLNDNIDLLAFSGHKGLYGPTGTGGLIISDNFDHKKLSPLKYGGTGSYSDKIVQPSFIPDKYESGTLNVAGLAGLYHGISYIASLEKGVNTIHIYKKKLVSYFIDKAENEISNFIHYIPKEHIQTGVISFNLKGIESSKVAEILSDEYNIMCRAGLHCSPLSHQSIGTFPEGTIRFSFSIFNTIDEIDAAVNALAAISKKCC